MYYIQLIQRYGQYLRRTSGSRRAASNVEWPSVTFHNKNVTRELFNIESHKLRTKNLNECQETYPVKVIREHSLCAVSNNK
jgi:hypothetical protein